MIASQKRQPKAGTPIQSNTRQYRKETAVMGVEEKKKRGEKGRQVVYGVPPQYKRSEKVRAQQTRKDPLNMAPFCLPDSRLPEQEINNDNAKRNKTNPQPKHNTTRGHIARGQITRSTLPTYVTTNASRSSSSSRAAGRGREVAASCCALAAVVAACARCRC